MHRALQTVRRLWHDKRGNFATITGLLMGVFAIGVVGSIELAQLYNVRSALQNAADAAALAAARELSVTGTTGDSAQATVRKVVGDLFFANTDDRITNQTADVSAAYVPEDGTVTVRVSLDAKAPPLLRYALTVDRVNATSKARIAGRPNVCVVALDKTSSRAIAANDTSVLNGRNCGVYSNSSADNGIMLEAASYIRSLFTCTKGGAAGPVSNYKPGATTDCPAMEDPLSQRPEPANANAACDEKGLRIRATPKQPLSPGVYCGGLEISGTSVVTFQPGTYIIKDGEFKVVGSAKVIGAGVSFFMTGIGAALKFQGNSAFDLQAPESGDTAGLLFFESRNQSTNEVHRIWTDRAERLVGAIYLPRTTLEVDAPAPVAANSEWTAIIVRKLLMLNASQVVLNSDFAASDVPAPAGIQGTSEPPRLVY